VLDAEEEKLTNALVKVTRSGKRIVYVLKGHGEREIGNTDRNGFSQAKEQMEKANYEVKELVLAREPKVPDDAALVIFPGPRTDFFPPELQALDAYLGRGGKAFFMATPFQGEALAKYIQKYGITLDDDVVIEVNPIAQVFGVGPLVPIVSQYESHPITKDLGGVAVLFPLTRSMEAAKTPPAGVNVTALARTSSRSWGETDKSVFQHGEAKPDPGEKTGPLPVAMVATLDEQAQASPQSKPAGSPAAEDKKPAKSRIVVVGTADFASNQFLGAQGNRDFFLNVVSWLAEQEDQISIRPKDTRQNPVVLTAAQSNLVLWLPLFVLPGAVLLCGIAVVIHRRRLN
jgi:gliding motility-associatede transport system auxiliary component